MVVYSFYSTYLLLECIGQTNHPGIHFCKRIEVSGWRLYNLHLVHMLQGKDQYIYC